MPNTMPRGFTLVELLALIVLVGVLGAALAPRFFSTAGFDARGFADQSAAFLRYAQKLAIARRGAVHVQQDDAGLTLCAEATAPCPEGSTLAGPAGGDAYRVDTPYGVDLDLAGGNFAFDAQGRPSAARVLTIEGGDSPHSLTVEAETGYVH